MARHILVKEIDHDYLEKFPDSDAEYLYSLRCVEPDSCNGWQECTAIHESGGFSAAEGPHDCPERMPWCDEEEFVFHGVLHTWMYSNGWTVPFDGCVVIANDWEPPDEVYDLPAGEYPVEDDWDCEFVFLNLIKGK